MTRKQFITRNMSLEMRFWLRVLHPSYCDNDCWEWTGKLSSTGYGRMVVDGTLTYAHRISWKIHFGDVPDGMHVLHTCDNRRCVNPKHLFLGTNNDNIEDKIKKGRQSKGIERPASKLSDEDVKKMRNLHSSGNYTYQSLANMFGMALGQTWMIINKKAWKHVA